MAEKKFFVDINLQGNKLANSTVGANSSMTVGGSFRYAEGRLEYFDGATVQEVANLSDISAITGGLIFQGGYNPTTNTPDITDGTALKGFFWAATQAGSFLGESVQVGDSIIAKVDNAGATFSDWLILQGNVVIATDTVDGIVRLATQGEADAGTEGGAVVITPATLQGKIDAQITPEISSKLPLSGGTMSGAINMDSQNINNVESFYTNGASINYLISPLNANTNVISGIPTPENSTDATNKTYVDGAASTAQANAEATAAADATAKADAAQAAAEAYADSLAPNYDAAGSAATAQANAEAYADSLAPNYDAAGSAAQALTDANAYTDTGLAAKLNLAGGTMSGNIEMDGNYINNASYLISNIAQINDTQTGNLSSYGGGEISLNNNLDAQNSAKITNLPTPTDNGDAANKGYVDTAAATAETNANSYTDTEIAAQSYVANIEVLDWTLESGSYYFDAAHGLDTSRLIMMAYDTASDEYVELSYARNGSNTRVFTNILPVDTLSVSFVKAQ